MRKSSVRTLGFLLVGLLVLYGAVNVFSNGTRAWGAASFAGLLIEQNASAQQAGISKTVPPYLTYQGILRDPEGNVQSGVHKITFRIYDRLSAPLNDAIWVEEHAEVTVRNGFFSVLLGQGEPLSPALFASPNTFIGVTVDPFDETVPRQRFASLPYAIYADHASALKAPDGKPGSAVYVDAAGAVGVGMTNPQAQLHISGTTSISPTVQVNAGNQQVRMDENALAFDGQLRLNATSPVDLLLAGESGRAGVGLSSPLVPFHIVEPSGQTALQMDMAGPGNGATVSVSPTRMNFSSGWRVTTGPQEQTAFQAASSGNISIGTTDTRFNLSVAGETKVDTLNVNSGLRHTPGPFFTQFPVAIYRFTNLTDNYEGSPLPIVFTPDLYECVVMGWAAKYDPDDVDSEVVAVWTYAKNNRWYVRAQFPSHIFLNPPIPGEKPAVDVVCFNNRFALFEDPPVRTFEGAR
jgi:hypothetical protein